MCRKVKCIATTKPSKVFKQGRSYRVISVTGFSDNMLTIVDDLGHERKINSDSMKFLLGCGRNFQLNPQYAYFDVDLHEIHR